jgi:hypothetical protein
VEFYPVFPISKCLRKQHAGCETRVERPRVRLFALCSKQGPRTNNFIHSHTHSTNRVSYSGRAYFIRQSNMSITFNYIRLVQQTNMSSVSRHTKTVIYYEVNFRQKDSANGKKKKDPLKYSFRFRQTNLGNKSQSRLIYHATVNRVTHSNMFQRLNETFPDCEGSYQ